MTTISDEEWRNARDLCIEVCHDLINRAMRNEVDEIPYYPAAQQDRAKEAAIRMMLDTIDALKAQVAAMSPVVAAVERIQRCEGGTADVFAALASYQDYLAARPATINFGVSPVGTVSFRDGKLVP